MLGKHLQQLLSRRRCVSTTDINYTQNVCVSSVNAGVSASLFYTPRNAYSLIRPKTGNGLLIAHPAHNGFLRETFLSRLGTHLIRVSNLSWLALYMKPVSESNHFTPESRGMFWWVGTICLDTPIHPWSATTNFSQALNSSLCRVPCTSKLHLNVKRAFAERTGGSTDQPGNGQVLLGESKYPRRKGRAMNSARGKDPCKTLPAAWRCSSSVWLW